MSRSEEGKGSSAKRFLAEMKMSLSQVNFNIIVQALQNYKKTDNLDALLSKIIFLSKDAKTHSLLQGIYQFVRPHHKKTFDEKCQELTGQGCGYKPDDHSLAEDKNKALLLHKDKQTFEDVNPSSSSCIQLNTQLLNRGGHHLSQQGMKETQTGSAPKTDIHAVFLNDVKKALGAEKSAHLFQTIQNYKKTDNYENLVATVVSLFTERNENFNLLPRFGVYIRPHHKMQYRQLIDSLSGLTVRTENDEAVSEDQQAQSEEDPKV